jgi:hypothetical protein
MNTKEDIGNLALQMCGVTSMNRITTFDDNSKEAAAIKLCYDNIRRSELRKEFWKFAIKRAVTRNVQTTDLFITFPAWAIGSSYDLNDVVLYTDGFLYVSLLNANLGNNPVTATTKWSLYTGPQTASLYDSTLVYYPGELIFTAGPVTYMVLTQTASGDTPADGTEFHIFNGTGAVTTSATPYRKPVMGRQFSFVVPRDFLRLAPFDPRYSMAIPDYLFEGSTMISNDPGPLNWRFVRDVIDTTLFDPLFITTLAAGVARTICEEVTQSTAKLSTINAIYEKALYEARVADGIESGPIEAEEDSWITVRYDGGWGNFGGPSFGGA